MSYLSGKKPWLYDVNSVLQLEVPVTHLVSEFDNKRSLGTN